MFSIGTYNIQKPDETWPIRAPQVIDNIVHADLDVVALQEVSDLSSHQELLKQKLVSHGYSVSRHTEKPGVTAVGVAWKTDRFEVIKSFTGTYTNGADRKRCFSAVDLKDKLTNKVIRVASVHLYTAPRDGTEHLGIPQLRTFRELLERESGDISRLIIAGDFNADFDRREDASVLNHLAQKRDGSDYAYHTVEKDASRNKILTKGRNKLDWIFAGVKSEAAKLAPKVTPHLFTHAYPNASDHFMHALDVHYEDVPFVQRPKNQEQQMLSDEVARKLRECFTQKERLVRDDLIRAGLVSRDDCNQKTYEWVRQGLLVQQGRGRETYYMRGQAIGSIVPTSKTRPAAQPARHAGLLAKQGHGRDIVYISQNRVTQMKEPKAAVRPSNELKKRSIKELFPSIFRVFGQFLRVFGQFLIALAN